MSKCIWQLLLQFERSHIKTPVIIHIATFIVNPLLPPLLPDPLPCEGSFSSHGLDGRLRMGT